MEIGMTAVNNIGYINRMPESLSRSAVKCNRISVDAESLSGNIAGAAGFIRRIRKAAADGIPTVVDLYGFEEKYESGKSGIDMLFNYLRAFSAKHRTVRFKVHIGNAKYVL